MNKHKVVLVPFPFDDLKGSKVRPAICLTEPLGPFQHIVLAFITSRVPAAPLQTDLVVDTSDEDFETTGLRVSSTIQMHRLMTVTTGFIQRQLGMLSPRLQWGVEDRLKRLFELSDE